MNLDHIQNQINRERHADRTRQFEDTSPLAHGWQYSHRNEKFDMPVFEKGGAKLMHFEDNYLVEFPHYDTLVEYQGWPIEDVTKDVLKELSK